MFNEARAFSFSFPATLVALLAHQCLRFVVKYNTIYRHNIGRSTWSSNNSEIYRIPSAMDNGDFDNVSWRNEPSNDDSRPQTSSSVQSPSNQHSGSRSRRRTSHGQPQAGQDADAVDLAGIGEYGRLDCTVGSPLKENDGTKDAYISYSVTTQVASPAPKAIEQ